MFPFSVCFSQLCLSRDKMTRFISSQLKYYRRKLCILFIITRLENNNNVELEAVVVVVVVFIFNRLAELVG